MSLEHAMTLLSQLMSVSFDIQGQTPHANKLRASATEVKSIARQLREVIHGEMSKRRIETKVPYICRDCIRSTGDDETLQHELCAEFKILSGPPYGVCLWCGDQVAGPREGKTEDDVEKPGILKLEREGK